LSYSTELLGEKTQSFTEIYLSNVIFFDKKTIGGELFHRVARRKNTELHRDLFIEKNVGV